MKKEESIPLFFWSSKKFENKEKENYGDLLSKYLVEKISGRKVQWVHPKKQPIWRIRKKNYLVIGSIINHASKSSIVWGSGIIDLDHKVANADFRAVRGPQTRAFLTKSGYKCPEVYGDPALLLPEYYNPDIEKTNEIGIIPHYVDYPAVKERYDDNSGIKIIDLMTDDIEKTTREILSCKKIISSSLHGVILSHAYNIPAVWVKFSERVAGNNIKFQDYFESVGIVPYQADLIAKSKNIIDWTDYISQKENLPNSSVLNALQKGLYESCPFKPVKDD
jgi:pyruvyltransferase